MSFSPPTKYQARLFWTALSGLAIGVMGGLLFLLVWGLSFVLDVLSPVLWPLAVAGVIAYLLDPVVDFCERRGLSRPRAIVCVFAIALIIVAGVFASIVPPIVRQSHELAANIPKITEKCQNWIEHWTGNRLDFEKIFSSASTKTKTSETNQPPIIETTNNEVPIMESNTNESVLVAGTNAPVSESKGTNSIFSPLISERTIGWLGSVLPKAGSVVASWLGILVGLSLIPIYAFYLLLEKQGIQSKWTSYLPLKDSTFKNELIFILQSINDYLIAFFRGQVLVAICDGILYGIGFLIIGLPYALLLGAAAVVVTIIPFIGAIIIFITAMIIAFVQFGDWKHPLLVVAVFAVVQTLEGVVISPRIMKGRVGLHPLTIIIAVMVGTTLLGGLLGGILAIPLTAVMRVLLARYVWKRPLPKEGS